MLFSLAMALSMTQANTVPAIARAAGITVGQTTIDVFERRYGKGMVMTGGHPRGARSWYDRTTQTLIEADGFYFWKDGEVIDGVTIEWPRGVPIGRKVPHIRLRRNDLGILAKLRPGMTATQVQQALHLKLNDSVARSTGLIKYPGRLVNKDNDRYTSWEAEFGFGGRGLCWITISGD